MRLHVSSIKVADHFCKTSSITFQGACKLHYSYDNSLIQNALLSLQKIKQEINAKNYHKADMWCHFGTVVIRDPDEGEFKEYRFCVMIRVG